MSNYQEIVQEISEDEENFWISKWWTVLDDWRKVVWRCISQWRDWIVAILNKHGLLVSFECNAILDWNNCKLSLIGCINKTKTVAPKVPEWVKI